VESLEQTLQLVKGDLQKMKSAKDEAVGDIPVTTAGEATAKSANPARLTIMLILIAALAAGAYLLLNKPVAIRTGLR